MTLDGAAGDIERIVLAEQARHPIPGVSIGIVVGAGEIVASYGVTSVENPLPVTPDTVFQLGSITKTFLGTLIMHLVDRGELELDHPVRRWIPTLRLRDEAAAANVTLRHLLTHTAGWFGDHFVDLGWNDDALERYVVSMAELEQQTPLGTEWAYNNAAFSLAGRVVEVVTGRTVEEAFRELLFDPLGLEGTFLFARDLITYRFAVGHRDFGGVAHVARPWSLPRATNAAGGIASSLRDLLSYARFHMSDGMTTRGERYLSPDAIQEMRSPLVRGPLGQFRGIAWQVEDLDGVRVISHLGSTSGQQALLSIAPAKGFGLALLTNSSVAGQLQQAVTRWSFERFLGVRRAEATAIPAVRGSAEAAVGIYRNPGEELEIALFGGSLSILQRPREASVRHLQQNPPPVPPPVPVAFSRHDRLLLLDGPLKGSQVEILGRDRIRFGSRLYRRVDA